MKKERKEVKTMLELKQTGKNWFNIVDDGGCMVSGTKEELAELCQQIDNKVENGLSQKKKDTHKDTHIIILESDYNTSKVQMELSDSAYRLLCYLRSQDWLDSEAYFVEIDKANFENFI